MSTSSERSNARVDDLLRLRVARQIVDEQANDRGLWCDPVSISAEYLQQELRRLHAAIEGVSPRLAAERFLGIGHRQLAMGVSRVYDHKHHLLVGFARELSDDEMRSFHDYIREWQP